MRTNVGGDPALAVLVTADVRFSFFSGNFCFPCEAGGASMISVSQAVQGLASAVASSPVQLSRTALIAASLPPSSSVRLFAGTVVQNPLLYTMSGTLTPLPNNEADVSAQNPTTNVESTSTTTSTSSTSPAAAPVNTVPTTTEPTTAASPVSVAPAGNAETEAVSVTPMATNVFVDPDVKALDDFTANPVHGNLATALYINAANFRARQVSSATVVSAIDLPGPVVSLNAINVDVTDLGEQSAGGKNRSPILSSRR
jgi:hypothetical protein